MTVTATDTQAAPGPTPMTVSAFREIVDRIEEEVSTVMVGQSSIVRDVLICLIGGGHALLEGVPGLGKTMLVRTLGEALDLQFSRIQFTPDLMPADITGTNILIENQDGSRQFAFQPGPIFANLVLADEINRATPKTQSALLEGMAERTVTVANVIHPLQTPFFVLATQNPLEMEGTYPLPEAQLDRFFFKLVVPYPGAEDLTEIIRRTTAPAMPSASEVANGETIHAMGQLAREIPISTAVTEYVVRLTLATHPESEHASPFVRQYVRYGVSPRGAQAIVLGAKIRAIMEGRLNVAYDDIRAVVAPALRHRLILNFDAESSGVSPDTVIAEVVASLPE